MATVTRTDIFHTVNRLKSILGAGYYSIDLTMDWWSNSNYEWKWGLYSNNLDEIKHFNTWAHLTAFVDSLDPNFVNDDDIALKEPDDVPDEDSGAFQ